MSTGFDITGSQGISAFARDIEDYVEKRQEYLHRKYVQSFVGLPLALQRRTLANQLAEEVTVPWERAWIVDEVAKLARAKEQAEQAQYGQAAYPGRFLQNLQKVSGAFLGAGVETVGAAGKLAGLLVGKRKTPENARFLQALEDAKLSENPYIPESAGLSLRAAAGAAAMAPDMAAGLAAGAAGGPAGMYGYWLARLYPERAEEYLAMGVDPGWAHVAGLASASTESAIELINIDPTGTLLKSAKGPTRGFIKGQLIRGVAKLGKAGKHPVTRRAIGAAAEATGRIGKEALEEALQGAVQEAGKYIASKTDNKVKPREASAIAKNALSQALEALPGLAILGAPGGILQGVNALQRFRRHAGGVQRTRTETAMQEQAASGKAPSRKQWKEWKLPEEEGKSSKQRKRALESLVEGYHLRDQMAVLASNVAPTEQQWKWWGFPAEEGTTEEARRTYLQDYFVKQIQPEMPQVAPEVTAAALTAPGPSEAIEGRQAPSEELPAALQPVVDTPEQATAASGPMHHEMPMEVVGTGEVLGEREVVRQVRDIWGIPTGEGHVPRGLAGAYYRFARAIGLHKGWEASAATLTHEIAHDIASQEGILQKLPKGARTELRPLDYDPGQARTKEGFAEYFRAYVSGAYFGAIAPVSAKEAAPIFTKYFENWLQQRPEIKAKVDKTTALLTRLRRAGAAGRVMGQISETGYEERPAYEKDVFNRRDFWYSRIKDTGLAIQKYTKAAIERGYIPGGSPTPYDLYVAFRQAGPHFAAHLIDHGVFRLTGKMEKIGPSMEEAMAEITDDVDRKRCSGWMYANHAKEAWEKNINPGITLDDARDAADQLYDPRYERTAQRLLDLNNALIDMLVDVGEIDPESADAMKAFWKTYMPLLRAKPERRKLFGTRKMVNLGEIVKGRVGSGLQIIDPFDATLERAIRFYGRASTRLIVNKLIQVGTITPNMGDWIRSISPSVIARRFTLEEITKQLKTAFVEEGLPESAVNELLKTADPTTLLTIWRPNAFQTADESIIRAKVKGEDKYFQVHPELNLALGGLSTLQNLDLVTRIFASTTKLMKFGATRANLDFMLTNAFRDFQTFLIQGERGLRGAFDPATYAAAYVISELRKAAGHKTPSLGVFAVVDLWQKMGGPLSTYVGLDRNELKKGIKRAMTGKQGWAATGLNIAGTPEVASRLAEFAAVLNKLGWLERIKKGEAPPIEVLVKAINASHDVTVDFRRMGFWGRYINYYIPFFNARLEGIDKTVRTFKDHPGRTAMRIALQRIPLALLYWWYRHDDDDYKERSWWLDGYYTFADTEGNPLFRIPKPHLWGTIDSGIERMMDALYDKDPDAVKRWFAQVLNELSPMGYPSGITPIFEAMFNYDLSFRHRPIVSRELAKLEAPDQYYEYTSSLAKQAAQFLYDYSGGKIQLSPAKIDHVANGISGGLYQKVTEPVTKVVAATPLAPSDIPGLKGITLRRDYTRSLDDFYAEKEALDKFHESNKIRGGARAENLDRWRRFDAVGELLTDLRKVRQVSNDQDKSSIYRFQTGLARAALDRKPLARYPNPLANPEELPVAARAVVEDHIAKKAIVASRLEVTRQKGGKRRLEVARIAEQAATYLRDMEVPTEVAQSLMYARLRGRGMETESAVRYIRGLRKRL